MLTPHLPPSPPVVTGIASFSPLPYLPHYLHHCPPISYNPSHQLFFPSSSINTYFHYSPLLSLTTSNTYSSTTATAINSSAALNLQLPSSSVTHPSRHPFPPPPRLHHHLEIHCRHHMLTALEIVLMPRPPSPLLHLPSLSLLSRSGH